MEIMSIGSVRQRLGLLTFTPQTPEYKRFTTSLFFYQSFLSFFPCQISIVV